jgi:hypothetical protein
MPLKKSVEYPRYFQGTEDPQDIICFPAEGSLGTVYYLDIKRWAHTAIWSLSEMKTPPVDAEILRSQAIALGVPGELPPFKSAKPKPVEVEE